ncbi:hypothetical protein KHM83_16435 [Fusibacter paucivorans]|uniref:Uncharacterized protein n=1 Tax=Fusibacter paucivorans TaxID=76009 RepID=A0ABS5PSX6_9FIRM|nr:hypothetical protein [Fusibacter paucivorans]MBS7528278.1 hypothetical protein [Fusibacter paucivorans]
MKRVFLLFCLITILGGDMSFAGTTIGMKVKNDYAGGYFIIEDELDLDGELSVKENTIGLQF